MRESHVIKLAEMIKQRNLLNSLIENQLEQRTTRKPRKSNGKNDKVARGRQLHGRYLGHIRMLTKAQRKDIAKVRASDGYHAAIKAAKSLKAAKEA